MARKRGNNRAIKVFTNGRRSDGQSKLAERVGQVVKRADQAAKLASAGAARRAPPVAKQAILTTYGIGASRVTSTIKAEVKPSMIVMYASTRRFPLSQFGGTWRGPKSEGATAAVSRGQKKTYPGAFMAKGRIGGREEKVIYKRIGLPGEKKMQKYGRHKGKLRQPIAVLRGPSTHEMISNPVGAGSIKNTTIRVVAEFYVAELRRQYARLK